MSDASTDGVYLLSYVAIHASAPKVPVPTPASRMHLLTLCLILASQHLCMNIEAIDGILYLRSQGLRYTYQQSSLPCLWSCRLHRSTIEKELEFVAFSLNRRASAQVLLLIAKSILDKVLPCIWFKQNLICIVLVNDPRFSLFSYFNEDELGDWALQCLLPQPLLFSAYQTYN
jgi:hypothetical protein